MDFHTKNGGFYVRNATVGVLLAASSGGGAGENDEFCIKNDGFRIRNDEF